MLGLVTDIPWLPIVMIALLMVIGYFLNRYVFFPFTVAVFTSLSTEERVEALKREGCLYKRHRFFKSTDVIKIPFAKRDMLDMLFCLERHEFIEATDLKTHQVCYYWMKIKRYMMFFPFTSKKVFLEKETRPDVISSHKNWTDSITTSVEYLCPACSASIGLDAMECLDCGLSFG